MPTSSSSSSPPSPPPAYLDGTAIAAPAVPAMASLGGACNAVPKPEQHQHDSQQRGSGSSGNYASSELDSSPTPNVFELAPTGSGSDSAVPPAPLLLPPQVRMERPATTVAELQ